MRFGVWGFGIVGKSAIRFLIAQGAFVSLFDERQLLQSELDFISEHKIKYYAPSELQAFLQNNEYVIPSPGIDLKSYCMYAHKWIAELDLFYMFCTKPIVAITGSVGKTTVTTLLTQCLQAHGVNAFAAGNIGTGVLDTLSMQNDIDLFILEVSSFQLEYCTIFAPDLAIITNIYPNHLDRHKTYEAYVQAKTTIFTKQHSNQNILIPLTLYELFSHQQLLSTQTIHTFGATEQSQNTDIIHFNVKSGYILKEKNLQKKNILNIAPLASVTFPENWLIIGAALDILSIAINEDIMLKTPYQLPAHRLEHVRTYNGIAFYNDSKATVPASTLAALEQLKYQPIILLLGGTSKGIDRSSFIASLKHTVMHIICFGAEADALYRNCINEQIAASYCNTLSEAFNISLTYAQPGTTVLLSPSGASYDLFKNYEERGTAFKQLVHSLR